MQLYRYLVSQSSEFFHHNPLCCFSMSVYCYCCLFRYRLSPKTFGYTLYMIPVQAFEALCPSFAIFVRLFVLPTNVDFTMICCLSGSFISDPLRHSFPSFCGRVPSVL